MSLNGNGRIRVSEGRGHANMLGPSEEPVKSGTQHVWYVPTTIRPSTIYYKSSILFNNMLFGIF